MPSDGEAHPWVVAGHTKVRFGVSPLGPIPDWEVFFGQVERIEQLGFDSFWWPDHPALFPDCWTVLTALAQKTSSIRLGSAVSCIYYRPPGVLSRSAAEVDRLSNGRLVLGLGIGDLPFEFARLGLDFPPVPVRLGALAETLQIVQGAWRAQPFSFQGEHYQADEIQISPPVQKPFVPVLIGGGGNRTLRQAAQYADAVNFGPLPVVGGVANPEGVEAKFNVLRGHCSSLGRSFDSILRTHYTLPLVIGRTSTAAKEKLQRSNRPGSDFAVEGSVEEITEYYRALVKVGMRYFIVCPRPDDTETVELLASEIVPAVQVK